MIVAVVAFVTIAIKLLFYPTFNSENWKNNADDRSKYVHSLINSGLLKGKKYEEVLSLLGRPDMIKNNSEVGRNEHIYNPNNSLLEYTIGDKSNIIDVERVQVHIQNNIVVKVNRHYD